MKTKSTELERIANGLGIYPVHDPDDVYRCKIQHIRFALSIAYDAGRASVGRAGGSATSRRKAKASAANVRKATAARMARKKKAEGGR